MYVFIWRYLLWWFYAIFFVYLKSKIGFIPAIKLCVTFIFKKMAFKFLFYHYPLIFSFLSINYHILSFPPRFLPSIALFSFYLFFPSISPFFVSSSVSLSDFSYSVLIYFPLILFLFLHPHFFTLLFIIILTLFPMPF